MTNDSPLKSNLLKLDGAVSGWRRIGEVLGISERSARRWERLYGLPILRLPGGSPVITRGMISKWVHNAFENQMGNNKPSDHV